MNVAVTGHKGRLGAWLVKHHDCFPLNADITDKLEVLGDELFKLKPYPDAIINCAAWTNVDEAEDPKNLDKIMAINMRGPGTLRRALDASSLLVHISTGFIFDGKTGPASEADQAAPLSVYGWSKWGGELASRVRPRTLVVRTLDLYGPNTPDNKSDFVRDVRDMLELGAEMELPANLDGTPTYIPHLAEALIDTISREAVGTLHIAGNVTLSRFEWGRKIAKHFGHDPDLIQPTSEIKGVAPRPLRGGLRVDRAIDGNYPIYSPDDGLTALESWERAHVSEGAR